MAKPKLTYFDAPVSRGEECRLALHLAGVDFEDVRVKGRRLARAEATTPYGSMPTLEIPNPAVRALERDPRPDRTPSTTSIPRMTSRPRATRA